MGLTVWGTGLNASGAGCKEAPLTPSTSTP